MTILYEPRTMIEAMAKKPAPDRFLRNELVNVAPVISDTKIIELDKMVGSQAMATYVSRTGDPTIVNKTAYGTQLHVAPYVYEAIPMTPADMDTRSMGEDVYSGSAGTRFDRFVSDAMMELEDRLSVREEQQIADGLMDGIITVSGAGVSTTVDFQMPAAHKITLTSGDVWGTTTAIMTQIGAWATLLSNQGYTASRAYMAPDTAALLLNDTTVKALLDNRRIQLGEIKPMLVAGQRASYLGTLSAPGMNIDLYSYFGGYKTDSSTFVNFLTAKKFILVGEGLEIVPCYTKIENLRANGFRGTRFPNMWLEDSGKSGWISLESGPLMAIRNPEAIVSATVA